MGNCYEVEDILVLDISYVEKIFFGMFESVEYYFRVVLKGFFVVGWGKEIVLVVNIFGLDFFGLELLFVDLVFVYVVNDVNFL